jgi:hypothetical protein
MDPQILDNHIFYCHPREADMALRRSIALAKQKRELEAEDSSAV